MNGENSSRLSCRFKPRRPLIQWGVRLGFLAALAAISTVLYGRLAEPWLRSLVIDEFARRGYSVSMESLGFDASGAVVAHNATLNRPGDTMREIVAVDRVAIALNWGAALRGGTAIDHLTVRNARLRLPQREGPFSTLENLDARIQLSESQLRVSRAEWRVGPLIVAAHGTVLNPGALPLPSPTPRKPGADHPGASLEDLLGQIQFARPARLEIDFHADGANPAAANVRATLRTGEGHFGGYSFRELTADAVLQSGSLELREFRLRDAKGQLAASGRWLPERNQIEARLISDMDLPGLARYALHAIPTVKMPTEVFDLLTFDKAPRIDASVSATLGPERTLSVIGRFEAPQVDVAGETLHALRADFSWDGGRTLIRNLHLEHTSGRLTGQMLLTRETFRAALSSSINPNILRAFTTGRARKALEEWDFIDPPLIEVELAGSKPTIANLRGSGRFRAGRVAFRGVEVLRGSADLSFQDGAFTYENFWVERPEGFAAGTMTYDFPGKEIRLQDVVSTLDPYETCLWIDPNLRTVLEAYRFRQPPALNCDGRVQFDGRTDNDLVVMLNAPAGLEYWLLQRWLPVERVTARLHFDGLDLKVGDLRAQVYGGRVTGDTTVSLRPKDKSFACNVQFENVNFEPMATLYFDYRDSQGLLQGRYAFSGRYDDMSSLDGQGAVEIRDGDIFAIPYFGPLSGILSEIIPGVGFSRATLATATFQTRDGIVYTDDFEVRGVGFTMIGGGWLDFPRDKMDFNVRVNMRGAPGLLLFPMSKLFEYTSTGLMSEPKWRAKRFTSDSE